MSDFPSGRTAGLPPPADLSWFKALVEGEPTAESMLVFGSVARGDHHGRSDLDVAVLAARGQGERLLAKLAERASARFPRQLRFEAPGKLALYSADLRRKIDAFVVEERGDVARYIAGSRLRNPREAVLFDRTGSLAAWLDGLSPESDDRESMVRAACTRFAYHLEQGSAGHARGDFYRAHFNLEIALHCLAQLAWLAAGRTEFTWLPKELLRTVSPNLADRLGRVVVPLEPGQMEGACDILLELFRMALDELGHENEPVLALCEIALARDRYWNFRDSVEYVDAGLRAGVLFRGSSPGRYAADPRFRQWLTARDVRRRIDLRWPAERLRDPVEFAGLESIEAPAALPIDAGGDGGLETLYRGVASSSHDALRRLVEAIAHREGATLVHCQAGIDRTGILVALLQRLAGAPMGAVLAGYSASSGARPVTMVAKVLDEVERDGGVDALAQRAGIGPAALAAFRERMNT